MVGTCSSDMVDKQEPPSGHKMVVGVAVLGRDYYDIPNMEVKGRAENPTTADGSKLLGVPPGSSLFVDGSQYPVSGDVELDFTPGIYKVRVESPVQYKPKEFTIEINS